MIEKSLDYFSMLISKHEQLQLLYVSISDLRFFDRNAKTHDIEKIKRSLLRYGIKQPLRWEPTLNDGAGAIGAGNGRLEALNAIRQDGGDPPRGVVVAPDGDWLIPVLYGVEAATEQEAQSYAIDDNNLTFAGAGLTLEEVARFYDEDRFYRLLEDLDLEGVSPVSVDSDELLALLAQIEADQIVDEDDLMPAIEEDMPCRVQLGDVWELGGHRIACGDSTDEGLARSLIGSDRVNMVFTDPPYNINYQGSTKKKRRKIANDAFEKGSDFLDFLTRYFTAAAAIAEPGAAIYVTHADMEAENFRQAMRSGGWELKQNLIWVKQHFTFGRQDYQWQHEPILYGWKAGGAHHWYGDRSQTTVWHFDRPTASDEHPTMKPIDLIEYAIGNSSTANDVIYDGFLGSGSTLIAAQKTGKRKVYGFELDPKYCEVICQRYEKLTGHTAEKIGSL